MAALISGNRPPRLRVDRDRIVVTGGNGVRTETVTIMNDGGGVLRGTALCDVQWITIPSLRFDTPFVLPLKIEISPAKVTPGSPVQGMVTLVTNGGSARIAVEFTSHPAPAPKLTLDDRNIQFCNLRRGEKISFDLTLRNSGSGVLSGTIESESDWIEVKTKTLWTTDIQVIPIIINTAKAPNASHPVGKIRIRSSGGEQRVTIPIHFRGGDGPRMRIDPPRIRCSWEIRGTLETSLIIHNEGEGVLRGTIPSPVPWLKFIPSIFPVEKSAKILLKIDTRTLPAQGTLSIPVPIITNAGRDTLIVEVTAMKRTAALPPARRARPARYQYRSRLIAYGPSGQVCVLISSGRSGGEGEIYYISGLPDRCAKIFHPHRRTGEMEEKLRVMIASPPPADLLTSLAWPLSLLTDIPAGGRVIGYTMRLYEGGYKPAHLWYDEPGPRSREGMIHRYSLACTLSRIVAGVHRAGHVIGDLRENNILLNQAGHMVLIDTDSFQIRSRNDGKIFWSKVGTGEYLPPEHLDGSFSREGCDRRSGDHFALAVLVFQFLMDGVHPFQAKGPLVRDAPATTDKILLGHFSYESRHAGISPPDYAPPYDSIPGQIRKLFKSAFVAGHQQPSVRPDALSWEKTLHPFTSRRGEETPPAANEQPGPKIEYENQNTLIDDAHHPITLGERLFRTATGTVYRCSRKEVQILLPDKEKSISVSNEFSAFISESLPPSLVIPTGRVFERNANPVGWLIPEIDPERFVPWHIIADPQSRVKDGRKFFSFRHRIACSRNLAAALESARNLCIPARSLAERMVFVSPDCSVRILCVPGFLREPIIPDEGEEPSSLSIQIFRMLMDGYHPFHATGRAVKGFRSPERRMKAGLYPWKNPGPHLSPPPGAPPIETIPGEIRSLFHDEFIGNLVEGRNGGVSRVGPGIWFEVLDRIFSSLIPCPADPDHWHLPPEPCPWCRIILKRTALHRTGSVLYLPVLRPVPRLETVSISGYLMLPWRFRRPVQTEPCATPWGVILLPAERTRLLMLSGPGQIKKLTCGIRGKILLVPWKKTWIIPIGNPFSRAGSEHVIVPVDQIISEPDEGVALSAIDDISLIDEMIWTSTIDRLRGEGIGLRRPKMWRPHHPGQRKRPVIIMLMPLYLPDEQTADRKEVPAKEPACQMKKRTRKKGKGKGIRGKIQSMLRDFFEPVPEDS